MKFSLDSDNTRFRVTILSGFVVNSHKVGAQNNGLYNLIVISEKGLAQAVRAC